MSEPNRVEDYAPLDVPARVSPATADYLALAYGMKNGWDVLATAALRHLIALASAAPGVSPADDLAEARRAIDLRGGEFRFCARAALNGPGVMEAFCDEHGVAGTLRKALLDLDFYARFPTPRNRDAALQSLDALAAVGEEDVVA